MKIYKKDELTSEQITPQKDNNKYFASLLLSAVDEQLKD